MSRESGYKQATLELIKMIGCEHQVFTSGNTPQEVESAYLKALEDGKKEGYVPVLVLSDDTLAEYLGFFEDKDSVKEKIISSNEDGKLFLQNRFQEYVDDFAEDNEWCDDEEEALEELIGYMDTAEGDAINRFLAYNYKGNEIDEVILFRIPVRNPWEVVAWLPMGGWNECPAAEEMMAVAKYWYEQYGAVIATVSHDTLEFYVQDKVEDSERSLELAKEMYGFCADCVDQGYGSIAELWASIRKSSVWYFWWD